MKTCLKLFVVLILVVLSYMQKSYAQYTIDASFGTNGITNTGFGGSGEQNGDTPYDMLIQPDGKIITAGKSDGADGYFIAMARHSSNGIIDTDTFGDSGKVRIHFVARDQANAIALQPDGKIVAVGSQATSNAGSAITPSIYRFNSDGSIDTTFGNHGFRALKYDGVSSGQFYGVSVRPDGKIIAAGNVTANANGGKFGFGVMRFLPNGDLDTSYGNQGQAIIPANILYDIVGYAFTSDGEVIMASDGFNGQTVYQMAKFDSLGSPDTTFATQGYLETGIEAYPFGPRNTKLSLTSDDKILLAGTTTNDSTSSPQFTVFRFFQDGKIDSSFGLNGRAEIQLSTNDILYDISIGADEKILLIGRVAGGFGFAGLARLNSDGSMDTTFAPGGKFISDLNNNTGTHYLTRAIPLSDGSILACGYNFASGRGDFLLTKYIVNTTEVESKNVEQPNKFSLEQNYPNPFNPTTIISWQSAVSSHQILKIYDVLGNELSTLVDEFKFAGKNEVEFDASNFASGVYFYRLQAGNFIETKKMILLR